MLWGQSVRRRQLYTPSPLRARADAAARMQSAVLSGTDGPGRDNGAVTR